MKTPTPYFGPFRGPADRRRINLDSDEERAWWCRRLGVGESELFAAVEAVGSAAGLVAEHLARGRPKSAAARFALSRRSLYSLMAIAFSSVLCASCAGGDSSGYYRNSTAYWSCDDWTYGPSSLGCDRRGWDDWNWRRRHHVDDFDDDDRNGHVGGGGMGHREFQHGNQPPPFAGKDS